MIPNFAAAGYSSKRVWYQKALGHIQALSINGITMAFTVRPSEKDIAAIEYAKKHFRTTKQTEALLKSCQEMESNHQRISDLISKNQDLIHELREAKGLLVKLKRPLIELLQSDIGT